MQGIPHFHFHERVRKPRAANFTLHEQEVLKDLCRRNSIIDSKLNSTEVVQIKRETWIKISNEFVRTIKGSKRTVNELQGCWRRLRDSLRHSKQTSGPDHHNGPDPYGNQSLDSGGNPLDDHNDMLAEGWDSTVDDDVNDAFENGLATEVDPIMIKSEVSVDEFGSNEAASYRSRRDDAGPSSSNLSSPGEGSESPETRPAKRKWVENGHVETVAGPAIEGCYEKEHEAKMKMIGLKQSAVESKLSNSESERNLIKLQNSVAEAQLELIQNQQILAVEGLEILKAQSKAAKAEVLKSQIQIYKMKAECETQNIKIPKQIWEQVDQLFS